MKRNSRLTFVLIIAAVFLIAAALIYLRFGRQKDNEYINSDSTYGFCEDVELDRDGRKDLEEQNSDVKDEIINAYDYIINVMSQPQYWSESEYFPFYSSAYLEEEAREVLIDGSGWILKDEDTASFTRGYEGKLTICFSDYTALSEDTQTGITYHFDFKNEEYYAVYESSEDQKRYFSLNKDEPGYFNTPFGMLEKTFSYYENIFSTAGCSILEKPNGTLFEYKQLSISMPEYEVDNLMHFVWENEEFSFNWQDADITWLEDYRDIANKYTPESELADINIYDSQGNVIEVLKSGIYSPLYLVLADEDSSSKYTAQDSKLWFEDISEYDNITESFAAYFLAPAMRELYGTEGVYFTKYSDALGTSNPLCVNSKEEFNQGFSYDFDNRPQIIIEVLPHGEEFCGASYTSNASYTIYQDLIENVKSLYEYYEADYPYGEDYLGNFIICYSLDAQRLLGLR